MLRQRHAERVSESSETCYVRVRGNGTCRGKEMKLLSEPTTTTTSRISDNPLDIIYECSEAAIPYNRWKMCECARARVLTRRRTEGFIEGSMNFERNIVNPSARWTEKVSPSTGNIVHLSPTKSPSVYLSLSLSLSLSLPLSLSLIHSLLFFPMRVIAASVSDL